MTRILVAGAEGVPLEDAICCTLAEAPVRCRTDPIDILVCAGPAQGLGWLAALRAEGWGRPVLALTGPGAPARIAALHVGADDALSYPCDVAELSARIQALLRRAPPILRIGDLTIDAATRRVERAGRSIDLLPREYALLLSLAEARGALMTRTALLAAVWRLRFDPGTNVVEVHVCRLRAKLDRGFAIPLLQTVKGQGYRLAEPGIFCGMGQNVAGRVVTRIEARVG